MIKIATHDAKFHTDDVFAVATLFLVLGKENCSVERTRDKEAIESADYVLDVGEVYDPDKNRFDHHQRGGAGQRPNGIPYASFGLIWKKFGSKLCRDQNVAEAIDKNLVQSIDSGDNGYDTLKTLVPDFYPYDINKVANLYRATWKEEGKWDERFLECVDWAAQIIQREIKITADWQEGRNIIMRAYESSTNKRLVLLENKEDIGRELVMDTLKDFPEPIYAVLFRPDHGNWQVVAIRKQVGSYESRKPLPEEWQGKSGKYLELVTGVAGSVFCHRTGFMCVTDTKEGALELAQRALNA